METRKGQQRYRCCQCYKTYSEPRNEHLGGIYTAPEKVEVVVRLFVEGCSVRSIERITGIHRIHQTLRVTPAMEAEITDRVWTIEEVMGTL